MNGIQLVVILVLMVRIIMLFIIFIGPSQIQLLEHQNKLCENMMSFLMWPFLVPTSWWFLVSYKAPTWEGFFLLGQNTKEGKRHPSTVTNPATSFLKLSSRWHKWGICTSWCEKNHPIIKRFSSSKKCRWRKCSGKKYDNINHQSDHTPSTKWPWLELVENGIPHVVIIPNQISAG